MKKTQLTTSDMSRLDAARGYDKFDSFQKRQNQNASGERPSVDDYNHAIRTGQLCGQPIVPVGAEL